MPQSPPIYGGPALIQIQSNDTDSSTGARCSSPLLCVDQDLLGAVSEMNNNLDLKAEIDFIPQTIIDGIEPLENGFTNRVDKMETS